MSKLSESHPRTQISNSHNPEPVISDFVGDDLDLRNWILRLHELEERVEGLAKETLPVLGDRVMSLEGQHEKLASRIGAHPRRTDEDILQLELEFRDQFDKLLERIAALEAQAVGLDDSTGPPPTPRNTSKKLSPELDETETCNDLEQIVKRLHNQVGFALAAVRSANFTNQEKTSVVATYQARLFKLRSNQLALVQEAMSALGGKIFLEDGRLHSEVVQSLSQNRNLRQIDDEIVHIQSMALLINKMGIMTEEGGDVGELPGSPQTPAPVPGPTASASHFSFQGNESSTSFTTPSNLFANRSNGHLTDSLRLYFRTLNKKRAGSEALEHASEQTNSGPGGRKRTTVTQASTEHNYKQSKHK
ncbi:hypothetical protein PtA15_13A309 [Puccinia triticina]|uniref:Syntaxin N-terminal domain-containing protein n=1 Tax=Puccinia triticina TaxID=208348 RepID=A0ABY7D230_9BASI|nr:uncharacterized protein PtA15_13A309 [Puccinia triticina]WAQ90909.1 hypothetical protein PtA15_13A309 [Puccinia triticina]